MPRRTAEISLDKNLMDRLDAIVKHKNTSDVLRKRSRVITVCLENWLPKLEEEIFR